MLLPELAICVPTLWRPHIMEWSTRNFALCTPHIYKTYFGISESDPESQQKAVDLSREFPVEIVLSPRHSAIAKINLMFRKLTEPFALIVADRIEPSPGWYERALELLTPNTQVLGIASELEPSTAAAFLVRRGYDGVIDCPGKLLNDSYEHEFADAEFKHTAIKRGVYRQSDSNLTFRHHTTRFPSSLFPFDKTNERSLERHTECQELYFSRVHLWT